MIKACLGCEPFLKYYKFLILFCSRNVEFITAGRAGGRERGGVVG